MKIHTHKVKSRVGTMIKVCADGLFTFGFDSSMPFKFSYDNYSNDKTDFKPFYRKQLRLFKLFLYWNLA